MFKKENFRTVMRISASREGRFFVVFVVITITVVVADVDVVRIFVKSAVGVYVLSILYSSRCSTYVCFI
jgi:hypothetical protein